LTDAARGRRPEWLGFFQRLAPDEEERGDQSQQTGGEPKRTKVRRSLDFYKAGRNGCGQTDDPARNHDGAQGAAVERRPFHESANDLKVLGRPVRFHELLCSTKQARRQDGPVGIVSGLKELPNSGKHTPTSCGRGNTELLLDDG